MKQLDRFFEMSRPHFGQFSVWLLLAFSLVLAAAPINYVEGERMGPATTLSFLPDAVLSWRPLYHISRVVLALGAVLWLGRWLIPYSCWATAISFLMVWALRMENNYHAAHIFNVTCMLLFVHAAWFHFYSRPIRASLRDKTFWRTPLYPRWVFALSVFHIAFFHTLAGVAKIAHSGFGWGDGLSLQLWVHLWGWEGSPFRTWIVSSRTVAMLFQTSALIFETVSILAIFNRYLRVLVGLGILGFYVGVLGTFVDFGFHCNAILVAWFLLPVEAFFRKKYSPPSEDE